MSDDSDERLARRLHAQGRIPLEVLQGLLRQARAGAGGLGALLTHRGLLSPADLASCMGELQRMSADGVTHAAQSAPPETHGLGDTARGSSSGRLLRGFRGPPNQVGPYRLLEQLGAGGMGTVHLAEHVETGSRYAVKLLPARAMGTKRARFQREGEAQAQADAHRNVVKVHSAGEDADYLYLAMDLCTGGDLSDRLERDGALAPDEAARICAALADGLDYVHSKGVLHRDLKPANVLMDPDGVPKLVDFGLARTVDAETLTKTGAMMGTPAYMAPEQAKGKTKELDARTDVYGLGMILYECLTGELPFTGPGIALIRALVSEPPPRPRSIRAEIPDWLERVCLKALAKEQHDRYQSAAEFALALRTPQRARLSVLGVIAVVALGLVGLGAAAVAGKGRTEQPAVGAKAPVLPVERVAVPAVPELSTEQLKEGTKAWRRVLKIKDARGRHEASLSWLESYLGHPKARDAASVRDAARLGFPLFRVPEPVLGFCLLPDGRIVASHYDGSLKIWEGDPLVATRSWHPPLARPSDVTPTPDSSGVIVTTTQQGDTASYFLDLDSDEVNEPLVLPAAPTQRAMSPRGPLLALSGRDRTVYLVDLLTGETVQRFEGQKSRVLSIGFSPDGSRLLICSGDTLESGFAIQNMVRLWDVDSGDVLGSFGSGSQPNCAVFLPGAKQFLVGSSAGVITLHDTADVANPVKMLVGKTGKGLFEAGVATPHAHSRGVRDLLPMPDGRLVSFAGDSRYPEFEMRVWTADYEEQHMVVLPSWPDHADLSADSTRVLVRYAKGATEMWPVPDAETADAVPNSKR